jgi:hypothetical protein
MNNLYKIDKILNVRMSVNSCGLDGVAGTLFAFLFVGLDVFDDCFNE